MSYRKQIKEQQEADKAIRNTILFVLVIGIVLGSVITYFIIK